MENVLLSGFSVHSPDTVQFLKHCIGVSVGRKVNIDLPYTAGKFTIDRGYNGHCEASNLRAEDWMTDKS